MGWGGGWNDADIFFVELLVNRRGGVSANAATITSRVPPYIDGVESR